MLKLLLVKSLFITAMSVSLLPVAAQAGQVQNRLNNQQARLQQGVNSGQITRGEDNHISAQDARIQAERNRDLQNNGGHLTPGERNHLNEQLNRTSAHEYYDKHNYNRQPGAPLR